MEFTTKYESVYDELAKPGQALHDLSVEDFGVVLPLEQILSARRFEPDIFDRHFGSGAPARG